MARAARIYSVVLPALALGVVVKGAYALYHGGGNELAGFMSAEVTPLKIATILTFTGQLWTLSIGIPWDGPIWSLNYEVFYYLLFGVLTFMTGRRRTIVAIALCVIAGPKILVLMPCWWAGVFLARRTDLAFPSRTMAWVAVFAAPMALWLLNRSGFGDFIKRDVLWQVPGFWRLEDATNFVAYYVDTVFIAAAFMAARQLRFGATSLLMQGAPVIQWLAGYTFSLYLFHRPFQNLLAQITADYGEPPMDPVLGLGLILVVVARLGSVTEKRKEGWRRLFTALLGQPAPALRAVKAASPS